MRVLTDTGRLAPVQQHHAAAPGVWPDNLVVDSPGRSGTISLVADRFGNRKQVRFATVARANPWVRQAVSKRAGVAARVPLHLYGPDGDDGRVRVRAGAAVVGADLADLLDRPGPRTSPLRWRRKIFQDVLVHADGIIEKVKRGSQIVELQWHPRSTTKVHLTDDGLSIESVEVPTVRRSWWQGPPTPVAGQSRFIDVADIIIVSHGEDTEGPLGVSPLEALTATHALHDAAWRFAVAFLEQGVFPSGVIELPANATEAQARITREFIQKMHEGVDQAGKILTAFGKFDPMSFTPDAAQLVDLARQSREEVAAAYGEPQSQQDSSKANRATSQTDRESWVRDVVGGDIAMLEGDLNAQLVAGVTRWRTAGLVIEGQMAEQLRPDMRARAEVYDKAGGGPWMTRNEIRKLENLPPVDDDDADRLLVDPGTPGAADDGDEV